MAIPESDLARIQKWCHAQVPEEMRDRVRVEADVTPRHVTVVEVHVGPEGFDNAPRTAVARLRYTARVGQWSLYWADRNSDFHEYQFKRPNKNVKVLLEYLDSHEDPIFWG